MRGLMSREKDPTRQLWVCKIRVSELMSGGLPSSDSCGTAVIDIVNSISSSLRIYSRVYQLSGKSMENCRTHDDTNRMELFNSGRARYTMFEFQKIGNGKDQYLPG